MVTLNPRLDALGAHPLARLQRLVADRRASGEVLVDLSIGDPDEETPAAIREALVAAVTPVSSYPLAAGSRDLRCAIAGFLARRHGVTVDPDRHVLASSGSKEAIFHLPLAVIDPDGPRRHVLYGTPGYPIYARGTLLAGGVPDPVRLTHECGWRLDLAALAQREPERVARAAIVWINHPHNPTGACVDRGWLTEQLAVAHEHDVLVCSDECYQEVWFDAPPPSVLEATAAMTGGEPEGVLAFLSLSKRSGMTGYRSGAIVGDAAVIARLRELRDNTGSASPPFVQAAAAAAWAERDHVGERRAVFAAKRERVLALLDELGLEVSGSEATFYVWLRVPGGDDLAYAEGLLAHGVVVTPGRAFGDGGEGWLRLALVPTLAGLEDAAVRWRDAIAAGSVPEARA
jgi:succinyldiaminopimelate transaminase